MERNKTFVEKIKGKIIIAFTLVLISLGVMWGVNRLAFEKISSLLQELSMPNEKLTILRKVFIDVSNLPHLQQIEVLKGKSKPSNAFLSGIKEIRQNVDSFRAFIDEPRQLSRLDSITSLLALDTKLFSDYLKLQYQIQQKKVFEHQLSALSQKMDTQKVQVDSNVITSEKKITTTTIIPADSVKRQEKKQSWIKRIFGKPKQEEVAVAPAQPQVIVEEQVKSRVDTLSVAKTDTSLAHLGTSLRKIESGRVQRINQLLESEVELSKANNVLIHQLLKTLNEVEKEEMEQVRSKTASTVLLAHDTIDRTRLITILFISIAIVFAILILVDVTRTRRYRAQLEDAKAEAEYHSASKQRFLSNMSHEIRTPLQSIIGYSEQQLIEGKANAENITAIYNSSQHLLQIVNEVLDYSRITSGKFSFEREVFSIIKVLEEVTSGVQLLAAKKSLKLELDVPSLGSLEYVLGDAFRLKQVLFNLLGNAIKFTEQGVIRLTVAARQHAGQVVTSFVVEDTGIGMNEEELHLIFNQFEQVGKSALNGQYGSGLGLSIVKELVEAQQGNITVQSTPGRGSRFEVVIPFAHTSELPAGVAAATPTVQPVFEGVIWLVDDDELILRLSSIIFNKYNIRHRCFNTAERLLDEPWNNEVKIIFADMRLPGISGAELCVLLRRKVPVSTQIIALTAQVLPAEKKSILRGGFNDLLLKPFTETALLNAIHEPSISKPPPAFPERSILNGMVSDYQEINLILQLCHDDTTSDIKELLKAVEENRDTASLIVHRLAGRVGQLGEKKLASRLRKSEVLIRNSNEMQQYKDEVHAIIADLNSFLKTLETELETVH